MYSRDHSLIKIHENMSEKDMENRNHKKPRVKTAVRKPIKQRKMIDDDKQIKPILSN